MATVFKPELCKKIPKRSSRSSSSKEEERLTVKELLTFEEPNMLQKRYLKQRCMLHKEPALGRATCFFSLPPHINNMNTTFGIKSKTSEENAYDVIFPPKKHEDILYPPIKEINRRKDDKPKFSFQEMYGIRTTIHPSGDGAKRAFNMNFCPVERAKYREDPVLGKPVIHGVSPSNLPEDFVFGKPVTVDLYTGEQLIQNEGSYTAKITEKYKAIAFLQFLREYIKFANSLVFIKKHFAADPHKQFYSASKVCKVLRLYQVPVKRYAVYVIGNYFQIIDKANYVNIKKFLDLLDTSRSIPDYKDIYWMDSGDHKKLTTYRELANDIYSGDVKCTFPSARLKESVQINQDNLSDETYAKTVIYPSIPTAYGLSHRDYFLLRSEADILDIFKKAFPNLKDFVFKEAWVNAGKTSTPKGDMVCVEEYFYTLKKLCKNFQRKDIFIESDDSINGMGF